MKWIGVLVVSPLWGMLSTRLFLQSWLAAVTFLVAVLGFVRGAVPRKDNALAAGVALLGVILFSLLLDGGFWLLTSVLRFGQTRAENIVYWVFAGLAALYILPQIPAKIRKSWRNSMIPASVQEDIVRRQLESAARHGKITT